MQKRRMWHSSVITEIASTRLDSLVSPSVTTERSNRKLTGERGSFLCSLCCERRIQLNGCGRCCHLLEIERFCDEYSCPLLSLESFYTQRPWSNVTHMSVTWQRRCLLSVYSFVYFSCLPHQGYCTDYMCMYIYIYIQCVPVVKVTTSGFNP